MIRRGGNGRGCETEKNPRRKKSEEEKEKETSSLSFTLTCEGLPSPNIHLFFHSHAVDFKRARFCSVSGFWSSFRGKREKTYYSLSPFFSFLSPSLPSPLPRGCLGPGAPSRLHPPPVSAQRSPSWPKRRVGCARSSELCSAAFSFF